MRILLSANHLNGYSGSETWIKTVWDELSKEHDVDVFTFYTHHNEELHGVSEYLFHKGARIMTLDSRQSDKYDLVLCSHYTCQEYIVDNYIYDKLYYISHGLVDVEIPNPDIYIDKVIPVSEEVSISLKKKGFKPSKVILNPIDLDRYKVSSKLKQTPERMLSMCQGDVNDKLSETWMTVYQVPTSRKNRIELTSSLMNEFDVVVSLGRGVYEALACGRCPVVYDNRHYQGEMYDGVVTKDKIRLLVHKNCSGRTFSGIWRTPRFVSDLGNFYVPDAEYYRDIAEEYFDSKKICKELIE